MRQLFFFKYKKSNHIKLECPFLNKLTNKAMVPTWDDSDKESTDEEQSHEMSIFPLIAIRDESFDKLVEVNDLPSYDEFFEAFKKLHNNLKMLLVKRKCWNSQMKMIVCKNKRIL